MLHRIYTSCTRALVFDESGPCTSFFVPFHLGGGVPSQFSGFTYRYFVYFYSLPLPIFAMHLATPMFAESNSSLFLSVPRTTWSVIRVLPRSLIHAGVEDCTRICARLSYWAVKAFSDVNHAPIAFQAHSCLGRWRFSENIRLTQLQAWFLVQCWREAEFCASFSVLF